MSKEYRLILTYYMLVSEGGVYVSNITKKGG